MKVGLEKKTNQRRERAGCRRRGCGMVIGIGMYIGLSDIDFLYLFIALTSLTT